MWHMHMTQNQFPFHIRHRHQDRRIDRDEVPWRIGKDQDVCDVFATCSRHVRDVWHQERYAGAKVLSLASVESCNKAWRCRVVQHIWKIVLRVRRMSHMCLMCVGVGVCVWHRDLAAEFDLELPFDTSPAGIANFCKEIARRSVSILKSSYGSCFQVTQRYLFDFDGWAAVPSMAWQRLLHWGLVLWSESCRSWNNLVSLPPVASISFLRLLDQIWPRHARHQVKNFFELIEPVWSMSQRFLKNSKTCKGGLCELCCLRVDRKTSAFGACCWKGILTALSWAAFSPWTLCCRDLATGHWWAAGVFWCSSRALHMLFTCSSHALHMLFMLVSHVGSSCSSWTFHALVYFGTMFAWRCVGFSLRLKPIPTRSFAITSRC